MIDKIEISDVIKLRKTLLITSFVGILFKELVQHSTGNIEFLGFKIPIADANIIPSYIGYLIIFLIITLLIRYRNDKLRKQYKERSVYEVKSYSGLNIEQQDEVRKIRVKLKYQNYAIIFIDIWFPIIFGLFTLIRIFFIK